MGNAERHPFRGAVSIFGMVLAGFAVSCGGSSNPTAGVAGSGASAAPRKGIDSAPEVRAADVVTDSFRATEPVAASAVGTNGGAVIGIRGTDASLSNQPSGGIAGVELRDQAQLAIKKAALNREFLIHASAISQEGQATSSGMQSRIVAFQQRGRQVILVEATQGHVVTTDLPSTLILAQFPILSENAEEIVIDFNAGTRVILAAGNWYGSDMDGGEFSYDTTGVEVKASFIDSIRADHNRIEIRQIAQVAQGLPFGMGTAFPTVEIRYYITPYRANPSYQPKLTSDFKEVGFFEVAPQLEAESGRARSYISKWDFSRPVTYYVSANTPTEYVDAVKEGILYWNQVFGREVLRAEVAPAGATAPDSRYNIVQWVPNDAAGAAYADGLMDPRTGEIQHAQIYMTSVFGISSRAKAARVLRRLKIAEDAAGTASAQTAERERTQAGTAFGLKGFRSARLCQFEPRAVMARGLEAALASGASDERILEVSRDYIREVVSHEVGHTLGLRHNFAGSLASNLTHGERDHVFERYVKTGELPEAGRAVPSSSTMEYQIFEDSVLSGAQMKRQNLAMTYDRRAVDWAYNNGADHLENAPLFCTDSQAETRRGLGVYYDCMRFDSGASTYGYQAYVVDAAIKRFPNALAEAFIEARTNRFQDRRTSIERTVLPVMSTLSTIEAALQIQGKWLESSDFRLLKVERTFPVLQSYLLERARLATVADFASTLQSVGGIGGSFGHFMPAESRDPFAPLTEVVSRVQAAIRAPATVSGVGYDGQSYSFTLAEVDQMSRIATDAASFFAENLIELGARSLQGVKNVPEAQEDAAEQFVIQMARAVVLAFTDTDVAGSEGKAKQASYPLEARKAAAKALSNEISSLNLVSISGAREALKSDLKAKVERILGEPLSDVNPSKVTRATRAWIADQKAILNSL